VTHDNTPVWTDSVPHIGRLPGGYTAFTTIPPNSRIDIGTAGLVAQHVSGPIAITPHIRVQDVLGHSPVDRDATRNDPSYLDAPEWSRAWQEAAGALPENRVVLKFGPPS
jgi:hypothetical protein